MHRCLIAAAFPAEPAVLALPETAAHHLCRVLRARPGEPIQLLDGEGRVCDARIETAGRDGVRVTMLAPPRRIPPPRPRLTLFQCVLKPARMDWLVEKAVELGVERLVPVLSQRCVARPEAGATVERWTRIADSALIQSGNARRMRIEPVRGWSAALDPLREPRTAVWCAALAPEAGRLADAIRQAWPAPPDALVWCVGPEGDFTAGELLDLRSCGATLLGLGDAVLRSETAALAGLSALRLTLDAGR